VERGIPKGSGAGFVVLSIPRKFLQWDPVFASTNGQLNKGRWKGGAIPRHTKSLDILNHSTYCSCGPVTALLA
jgi:hypothetical protein